jgi:hypothetical protein
MTSPPSPPNRHRRRIVVTIAVLILGGLGWWSWPRVVCIRHPGRPFDVHSFLIGKWRSGSAPTFEPREGKEVEIELLADGTGFETRAGLRRVPFTWSLDSPSSPFMDFEREAELGKLPTFGTYLIMQIEQDKFAWSLVSGNGRRLQDAPRETLERVP